MLLELGIADAYGSGFEWTSTPPVNDLQHYYGHMSQLKMRVGEYTDDTQMSIGTAEVVLAGDMTELSFATAWVNAFHRNPHGGYASGFLKFLQEVKTGEQFLTDINPLSDRSGSCMRVLPISFLSSLDQVKRVAALQAAITHNTPNGIKCAVGVAVAGFLLRHGTKPQDVASQLGDSSWTQPWVNNLVSVTAHDCSHAAMFLVSTSSSLAEILKRSADYIGDIDTLAAIACGLGSLSADIKKDLPEVLFDRLENGTYGRDFLIGLDQKLEKFGR